MNTAHAEFGSSPVGSEITEWDWSETEDGDRFQSFYTLVPSSAVSVKVDWAKMSVNSLLECVSHVGDPADYATRVVRFTVQKDNGDFLATTWVRYAEAAATLREW